MSKNIFLYTKFLESKYNVDEILDKITSHGIINLTFYEKQILKNPEIQKKLLYQHNIALNDANNLFKIFGIKTDKDLYMGETFYIDGEIMIGDYNEDKFHKIIKKIGEENFLYINKMNGKFIKNINKNELKIGWIGKTEYSNIIIDKIKCYPISINFFKDRIGFVLYNIEKDLIIELSPLEKEFKFSSKKDIEKYLNILKLTLKDKEIIKIINQNINDNFSILTKNI